MPAETSVDMDGLTIRPLAPDTWSAFADLVARHNGVFGGCWCTWFHTLSRDKDRTYDSNRDLKCRLVAEGGAHAALVFDGDEAVAWAQYGPPEELPNIHHRQEYEAGLERLPDYRITCIFVDRRYRRHGVAALALGGALDLIAKAGGGAVEGYPHDRARLTCVTRGRESPDHSRPPEDVMADELTDVLDVHVALELEPHLSKAAEPQLELRVEIWCGTRINRWRAQGAGGCGGSAG